MSLAGRCLLIEMMADYRGPGSGNGTFRWSCRRAAKALGVSKTTGARALIELHGGFLEIESEQTKGTEVKITLPSRHNVSSVTSVDAQNWLEQTLDND